MRPLLFSSTMNGGLIALYFVSFILLMQIVLTNVVVAVLLDKFVEEEPPEEGEGNTDSTAAPPESPPSPPHPKNEVLSRPMVRLRGQGGAQGPRVALEHVGSLRDD